MTVKLHARPKAKPKRKTGKESAGDATKPAARVEGDAPEDQSVLLGGVVDKLEEMVGDDSLPAVQRSRLSVCHTMLSAAAEEMATCAQEISDATETYDMASLRKAMAKMDDLYSTAVKEAMDEIGRIGDSEDMDEVKGMVGKLAKSMSKAGGRPKRKAEPVDPDDDGDDDSTEEGDTDDDAEAKRRSAVRKRRSVSRKSPESDQEFEQWVSQNVDHNFDVNFSVTELARIGKLGDDVRADRVSVQDAISQAQQIIDSKGGKSRRAKSRRRKEPYSDDEEGFGDDFHDAMSGLDDDDKAAVAKYAARLRRARKEVGTEDTEDQQSVEIDIPIDPVDDSASEDVEGDGLPDLEIDVPDDSESPVEAKDAESEFGKFDDWLYEYDQSHDGVPDRAMNAATDLGKRVQGGELSADDAISQAQSILEGKSRRPRRKSDTEEADPLGEDFSMGDESNQYMDDYEFDPGYNPDDEAVVAGKGRKRRKADDPDPDDSGEYDDDTDATDTKRRRRAMAR